jgi:polyisoprenyl-phosphate glycosyltransferase
MPKVIFDCATFGAYSFETDADRIHATNYAGFIHLLETVAASNIHACIHAGSSSEYGLNSIAPCENAALLPNSHYAVSKAAVSHAISYFGKVRGVPVANLRLYSVYGPYEDSSRLIPNLCEHALRRRLPPFTTRNVARDFVYVNDVVESFVLAALSMGPEIAGESFNIGTGIQTSLGELAQLARQLFSIPDEPSFLPSMGRTWDAEAWYANPEYAAQKLGWRAQTSLKDGLKDTLEWWREYLQFAKFAELTKKRQAPENRIERDEMNSWIET